MCKYVDDKGQVRSYQDMMKEAGYTLNLKKEVDSYDKR